jgi:hypothetical protein
VYKRRSVAESKSVAEQRTPGHNKCRTIFLIVSHAHGKTGTPKVSGDQATRLRTRQNDPSILVHYMRRVLVGRESSATQYSSWGHQGGLGCPLISHAGVGLDACIPVHTRVHRSWYGGNEVRCMHDCGFVVLARRGRAIRKWKDDAVLQWGFYLACNIFEVYSVTLFVLKAVRANCGGWMALLLAQNMK